MAFRRRAEFFKRPTACMSRERGAVYRAQAVRKCSTLSGTWQRVHSGEPAEVKDVNGNAKSLAEEFIFKGTPK